MTPKRMLRNMQIEVSDMIDRLNELNGISSEGLDEQDETDLTAVHTYLTDAYVRLGEMSKTWTTQVEV